MTPFLPTLTAAQQTRVDAWLPVVALLLNQRYGDRITVDLEPAFVSAAGEAIARRLTRGTALVDQQAVGPASVKYNPRAMIRSWFLPEELDELDGIVNEGGSGARTYRTPAPDAIRFGNRLRPVLDQVAESDGVYVEEF